MLARRNAAAVLGTWMMLGQPAPSSGLIFPKPIGAFRRCRLGTGPALRMGSQMPMRCVAPSASPLSLTPPFADEACVASDSSADSLLQRFVQDTMLNQQQTQIPTELLDVDESQSLHHRAFDLWGWLSQGLPDTDLDRIGQVLALWLPLLNVITFVIVVLAFPRSLGIGMQEGGKKSEETDE